MSVSWNENVIRENTRKCKIQNEEICLKIGVTYIDEKISKGLLRWFCHIQRRVIDAPVKKCEFIQVEGR